MIDMQTMVRPLYYSAKDTLRIFLRAYKVSDMDTLMILADEFEELEKEREEFAQEHKFSKTKSASRTEVTFRRCEETGTQERRGNDQWSPPNRVPRQQATGAPRGGQWTPPQQQQMQPANTVWRPPSTTQRPRETTHITDPQEACRNCGGHGHWARGCRHQRLLFCWVCGREGVRSVECCQQAGNAQRSQPQRSERWLQDATSPK